jgi:hypothetical protein
MWKWHGFGHESGSPGPGELSIFCPACPQPGVNLGAGWAADPSWCVLPLYYLCRVNLRRRSTRQKYIRQYAVDGNFTADHLKQKHPEDDVWLTDGTGFIVSRNDYLEHLKIAKTYKEVKKPLYPCCDSDIPCSVRLATTTKLEQTTRPTVLDAM